MVIAGLQTQLPSILANLPGVRLLYLFGSQVDGDTGPLSDVDLAILFEPGLDAVGNVALAGHLFQQALPGERIDVVALNLAPLDLAHAIIARGICLYERDGFTRVEYEAEIMSRYADYLPVLRAQRRDILQGGQHERRIPRYREALRRTERTLAEIRRTQRPADH